MLPPLLDHHQAEHTGCLAAQDAFGIPLKAYFMDGNLVAAHASDDAHALLRSLHQRGWIEQKDMQTLKNEAETGDIYELLLNTGEPVRIREVFYERFKENICRMIATDAPFDFESLDFVLMPNIHVGHDTETLLQESHFIVERSHRFRHAETVLLYHLGPRPTLSEAERTIASLLTEPLPLQALVRESPYEAYQTWDLIVDLIERGAIEPIREAKEDDSTPPPKEIIHQSREPRLSRSEAEEKISVASEITSAFHQATDKSLGTGAGRAQLRLLLDGSPSQHAFLFNGLQIGPHGSLDEGDLLGRLRTRIGPERRRILNTALQDLIQRTLSMADEGLNTQTMETLLSQISGHQSRMRW